MTVAGGEAGGEAGVGEAVAMSIPYVASEKPCKPKLDGPLGPRVASQTASGSSLPKALAAETLFLCWVGQGAGVAIADTARGGSAGAGAASDPDPRHATVVAAVASPGAGAGGGDTSVPEEDLPARWGLQGLASPLGPILQALRGAFAVAGGAGVGAGPRGGLPFRPSSAPIGAASGGGPSGGSSGDGSHAFHPSTSESGATGDDPDG